MKSHPNIAQVSRNIVRIAVSAVLSLAGWWNEALPLQEVAVEKAVEAQTAVWFFTLRNKIGGESDNEFYGGMRSKLRSGCFRIDFAPIPGIKEISEAAPFYLPGERITLQGIEEHPEAKVFREIKGFADNQQGNVIIYIHGYNIGFEKGCRQAAVFQRALDERHRVVLFSWPADGDLLKYTRDEADLMWSVPRMAAFFKRLVQLVGPGKVNVVAHSLGARGAVMALISIACTVSDGPFLNELVLMAPDLDSDVFRDIWPEIKQLAQRTTLYVSEKDKALKLSKEVHGYPRLGQAGEYLTVLPGLETIDVSLTVNRRASGHLYHLYTPEVVADLAELLDNGQSAGKRPNMIPARANGIPYWQVKPNTP